MKLIRTGRTVPFLDLGINAVFYAHNRFWTRVDYGVGATLVEADELTKACNFLDGGTVASHDGILCEAVELVEIQRDCGP